MLIEQGSILGLLEDDEIGETVSKIQRYPDDAVVDEDLATLLDTLWNSKCVQDVYDQRHNFQLPDSAKYYFRKIKAIGESGYIPSIQDVLRSRVRTSGIVEERYMTVYPSKCMT